VDGKCPDHDKKPVEREEANYFFRMSQYQDWLISYIRENPDFIRPERYRNEVLSFLREPLEDLCISRPIQRLSWGIPLPFDDRYVTYVWFDALINYYSATLDHPREDGSLWWPATVHLIGKDILTTHAVYWPTMLQAAGLPLPETILAHGWWTAGGSKMGKSVGNAVRPLDCADLYGIDAFRYFLMRDMVVGLDAEFTEEALINRINSDLANDLGNCLNRVERMIHNYWQDEIPSPGALEPAEEELIQRAGSAGQRFAEAFGAYRIHQAIEETMELARAVNRYLEVRSPWKAVKTAGPAGIATTLWVSAEAVRLVCALLSPVMPVKMGEALYRLGAIEDAGDIVAGRTDPRWLRWGVLSPGTRIRPAGPLFPRIETERPA